MPLRQTTIAARPSLPAPLGAFADALPAAPAGLIDALFGPDAPKHVFMLVDASLRSDITGFFDLDSIGQPAACLFDGAATESAQKTAPWLVDLTIPAPDNPGRLSFHRKFFQQHWPVGTSLLIQTDAGFDAIRRHLRRFTRLPVQDDGKLRFFRFWDPRVLRPFLDAIHDDAPRLRRMMLTDDGTPIHYVIRHEDADLRLSPVTEELAGEPVTPMRLNYADFDPIARARAAERRKRMADRICRDFARELEHRPRKAVGAAVNHALQRFGAYGFRIHAHLHFFAAWTVFYGADFESRDPTGKLLEICHSTGPEIERFKAFREQFERSWTEAA